MQKIGVLTLLMMATVLFMLAFPAIAAGPNPPAPPVVAAPAAPAAPAASAAMPERHPHIDEALEHMQAAKHELEIAAHDFKGHRVKSLEHLNQAIGEAEMCLKVGD